MYLSSLIRGNKTCRHRSFPAAVFHKGGPSGAQGNLAVEEASGSVWAGDALEGTPMAWLHSGDRQSRKVVFSIGTTKSASGNNVGVPRETFNQSTDPHPPKKPTAKLFNIWICLCHDRNSFWLVWVPEMVVPPALDQAESYLALYLACLPYQALKGLKSSKQKEAWKLAGLSFGRFWLMVYKEQTAYYTQRPVSFINTNEAFTGEKKIRCVDSVKLYYLLSMICAAWLLLTPPRGLSWAIFFPL